MSWQAAARSAGTLLGNRAGWWDCGQERATQLLLPFPGSSGASAPYHLKVKGQEGCVQDRTATAEGGLVPRSRHPFFVSRLDTPSLSLGIVLLPEEFSHTMVGRLWHLFSSLFLG